MRGRHLSHKKYTSYNKFRKHICSRKMIKAKEEEEVGWTSKENVEQISKHVSEKGMQDLESKSI